MTIGDYQLLNPLGQGAFGTVFAGQHRFLKRLVALKILPEELAGDAAVGIRFIQEMEQIGRLDHPHLVKIHDASFADGKYFIAMDCITNDAKEAQNLAQYLQSYSGPLPEEEVWAIAEQVAQALDYLHEQGYAHLGLKLNNIILKEGSPHPHVYLCDAGIARVIGERVLLSRTYEVLSSLLGTETKHATRLHLCFLQHYLFLAPEQKVEGRQVDGRADIFAFGTLLYYLLTRTFPEGVFDPVAEKRTQYQLLWDKLINRCLQANPDKRPIGLCKTMKTLLKPSTEADEHVSPMFGNEQPMILERQPIVTSYQVTAREEKIEPLPTDMEIIRGGSFLRGSVQGARDEMPRHAITLNTYAMDIYPVTNEQFARFLEAMGGDKDHNNNDMIRLRESRIKRSGSRVHIESGYAKHPVVGVTWYGAVAYAQWIGKRLPTEAEWEVAAYSGAEGAIYPTGSDIDRSQANFFSSDTTPVMSYPPSPCGLYDMAGNVYEWCQDWYSYQYYETSMQEPHNPKGPPQGVYRILRGGCWKSLKEDLRCAHRHRNNPGAVNSTYGFRCAMDLSP